MDIIHLESQNNFELTPQKNISENENEKVNSPIEFIKKPLKTFAQEKIESEKIDFNRTFSAEIPKNILFNSAKNDLIEYENRTFEFKTIKGSLVINLVLNGIFEKVYKEKTLLNNKANSPTQANIKVCVRTDKGTLTNEFVLSKFAKSNAKAFKEEINERSNYLIFNGDDKTLNLIRQLINNRCKETTNLLANSGSIEIDQLEGRLYENAYVDKTGITSFDANKHVKLPNGLRACLDASSGNQLPKLYTRDDSNGALEAGKLLKSMDEAFIDIGPFLALGLGIMAMFTEKIWQSRAGYPIGFLYGASKQGKTTIQNIISYIFGFDKRFPAMGNSTPKSRNRKANLYNSTPIMFTDISSRELLKEGFENNIVESYEGSIREKLMNGTQFNNLPQCSPLYFSSNYLPVQKDKMLNRMLPIRFKPDSFKSEALAHYFSNPYELSLIIPELLKQFDSEYILEFIEQIDDYLANAVDTKKDRESNNVAIAYTGLRLLEQIGGYSIANSEEKVKEYFIWYLDQIKELEDPVDMVLNNMLTMMDESILRVRDHFTVIEDSGEIRLTLQTTICLLKYNSWIGKIYPDKFINQKEFAEAVNQSEYFIERKTTRFHGKKSCLASATILNITQHPDAMLIYKKYVETCKAIDAAKAAMSAF